MNSAAEKKKINQTNKNKQTKTTTVYVRYYWKSKKSNQKKLW